MIERVRYLLLFGLWNCSLFTASVKNNGTAYRSNIVLLFSTLSSKSRLVGNLVRFLTNIMQLLILHKPISFSGSIRFLPFCRLLWWWCSFIFACEQTIKNYYDMYCIHCSIIVHGWLAKYLISLLHCHMVPRCWPTSIINFFHMLTTLLQRKKNTNQPPETNPFHLFFQQLFPLTTPPMKETLRFFYWSIC